MKKLVWLLVIVLSLILVSSFAQEEATPHVFDLASKLTQEDITKLEEKLNRFYQKTGIDVMLVTTNDSKNKKADRFAADFYEENRVDYLKYEKAITFALCFDIGRICGYGEAGYGDTVKTTLLKSGEGELYNLLAKHIPEYDFPGAMFAYTNHLNKLFVPKTAFEAMGQHAFVVLLVSLLIAFIGVNGMKQQLKTAKKKSLADQYMVADSLHLAGSSDLFLGRTVTRRRRESSRSGGGSSGSSGSVSSSSGRSYSSRSGSF